MPSIDNLTSDLPSPKSVSFQQPQQVVVQRRISRYNDRRPRSFSASRNREALQHTVEYLEVPKPSRTPKRDPRVHGYSSDTLGETELLPARIPPQYSYFDVFPFSLMVKFLIKRGRKIRGKKAARLRAKLHHPRTENLPLEISLYIVRFTFSRSRVFSLNDTPELVYCRASEPESYRCSHYEYIPCLTLKEITDFFISPS